MKKLMLLAAIGLSACGTANPGPSVPFQAGASLGSARAALRTCGPIAEQRAQNNIVGSYVGAALFGGLLLGPIVVAINEDNLREHSEINAADNCLRSKGFKRRDLTASEIRTLNAAQGNARDRLLEHFVRGGTVENFS